MTLAGQNQIATEIEAERTHERHKVLFGLIDVDAKHAAENLGWDDIPRTVAWRDLGDRIIVSWIGSDRASSLLEIYSPEAMPLAEMNVSHIHYVGLTIDIAGIG